jgi:predicted CXXCH cytochrome family protein
MRDQQTTHHRGPALVAIALGCTLFSGTAASGTILDSRHNFSTEGWSGGEICVVCHTPHNAITLEEEVAPLWNHELTTTTFEMYDSPTFEGKATQDPNPTGHSLLCLSCHDGSVALDAFGGRAGSVFMGDENPATVGAGGDLTDDHPISFVYDDALATDDGALHPPSTTEVVVGSGTQTKPGFISTVMLFNDKVQCSSCHDVHNNFVDDDPLLKISMDASKLCMTCHNK